MLNISVADFAVIELALETLKEKITTELETDITSSQKARDHALRIKDKAQEIITKMKEERIKAKT